MKQKNRKRKKKKTKIKKLKDNFYNFFIAFPPLNKEGEKMKRVVYYEEAKK